MFRIATPVAFGFVVASASAVAAQQAAPQTAQQAAPQTAMPAPIQRVDAELDAASAEIGRALFLRCLCAEDDLSFDAQGHVAAGTKLTRVEWTLAGVNVQKAERVSPSLIQLDGVRVAIRFAPDRHEFERHPEKDDTVRVQIADTGDAAKFERALEAIFATGIDRGLQKSAPDFWQHYFEPQLAWPTGSGDALAGVTPVMLGAVGQVTTGDAPSDPAAGQQVQAEYTPEAVRDRIRGVVVVRFVVDAEGVPRRVTLQLPMGYGTDERAVAAVRKMRFAPPTAGGKPVAVSTVMRVDFVVPAVQGVKPR